jgi:aspartate aminotransferase
MTNDSHIDRPIAQRVRRIKQSPSTAAAALARNLRAQGRDILDLTVGEPDADTPDHIKQAAIAAITAGDTKYTPVNGIPALRAAIIDKFHARTGIRYNDNEITVGGGAKQVIFMALTATVDDDAEVIIPAPYWVSYPDMVLANDGTPVVVNCPEQQDFKLNADDLQSAITDRTRWLILNAPGNPTGAAYTTHELRAIADVLLRHPQVLVLTDEIYDEIWFGTDPVSHLVAVEPQLRERVLMVNGVSKTYAMTGWRLGYAAGPAWLITAINTLQSQSSSCPSSISQAAAVAALTGDRQFISNSIEIYRERRDLVVKLLCDVPGLTVRNPEGAFYLFINCAKTLGTTTPKGQVIRDDRDFVLYLLEEAGVATIHGGAYGASPFFRISFATSNDVLEQACERISRACAALN